MEGRLVYIAAPYSKGDVGKNVWRAIQTADFLADNGFIPYIPHLTHFWHTVAPRPYTFWLEYDNVFLQKCDCVLRLDGKSSGADAEVKLAGSLGMKVYYTLEELLDEV